VVVLLRRLPSLQHVHRRLGNQLVDVRLVPLDLLRVFRAVGQMILQPGWIYIYIYMCHHVRLNLSLSLSLSSSSSTFEKMKLTGLLVSLVASLYGAEIFPGGITFLALGAPRCVGIALSLRPASLRGSRFLRCGFVDEVVVVAGLMGRLLLGLVLSSLVV
jgi:hypothetical protein